jgi:hypothetical protein
MNEIFFIYRLVEGSRRKPHWRESPSFHLKATKLSLRVVAWYIHSMILS